MRAALLFGAFFLCAGCEGSPAPEPARSVDGGEPDAAPIDLTGKLASELALDVTLGSDHGAGAAAKLTVRALWSAVPVEGTNRVETVWELCALPLPGLAPTLPFDALAPVLVEAHDGVLDGTRDGARFRQPEVPFVIGALLDHPATDPLPDGATRRCGDGIGARCVFSDPVTGDPGVSLPADGFTPDVDRVSVVARARFALDTVVRAAGTVDGVVSSGALEARVLACHRRGGGACSPDDVARIDAAHPRVTVVGGRVRSRAQGFYFTCPQLNDDPAGSLAGSEVPDGGAPPADLAGAPPPSFSVDVQADLDARGCATFGCHEPGGSAAHRLPLALHPLTDEGRRRNYQAVLPFTVGAEGGPLVRQVPLPPAMRARWRDWVAAGAPF